MASVSPPERPDDLDAIVRRADPDRWLASRFIGDAQARAHMAGLEQAICGFFDPVEGVIAAYGG